MSKIVTWQQIPSPIVTEMLCSAKFDGVVLDTEHSMWNPETLANCIQVGTLKGKEVFVRFTECSETLVRGCLDAGATGAIFAKVDSMEYAEKIKKVCLYPSQGGSRGLGLVRENMWGRNSLMGSRPVIILQIESEAGVRNIHSLKSDAIDFYMIGPYDLSMDLGVPGKFDDHKFRAAVDYVTEEVGVEKMGCHLVKNEQVRLEGDKIGKFGFVALSMDTVILTEGVEYLDNRVKPLTT